MDHNKKEVKISIFNVDFSIFSTRLIILFDFFFFLGTYYSYYILLKNVVNLEINLLV